MCEDGYWVALLAVGGEGDATGETAIEAVDGIVRGLEVDLDDGLRITVGGLYRPEDVDAGRAVDRLDVLLKTRMGLEFHEAFGAFNVAGSGYEGDLLPLPVDSYWHTTTPHVVGVGRMGVERPGIEELLVADAAGPNGVAVQHRFFELTLA